MRKQNWVLILLFCISSLFSFSAYSQIHEPIGATLSVTNVVTAEINRETRSLLTGDSVHSNEIIRVSTDASSEIKLKDDTKLALGPGATLLLDKFVYDPNKSNATVTIDLLLGAFRFITGVADKRSYIVKLPKATITVRGTTFDVYIEPNQTSWVLLHQGSANVCNKRGGCSEHDQVAKIIRVSVDGELTKPTRWSLFEGADKPQFDVNTLFPFVLNPPQIDPIPVFTQEDIIKVDVNDQETEKKKTGVKVNKPKVKKPKKGPLTKTPEEDYFPPDLLDTGPGRRGRPPGGGRPSGGGIKPPSGGVKPPSGNSDGGGKPIGPIIPNRSR